MPKRKESSKDPNKDINWPQLLEKAKEQPISFYVVLDTDRYHKSNPNIVKAIMDGNTVLDHMGLKRLIMPWEPPGSPRSRQAWMSLPCEYKIHFNYWDAWKELCLKNRKKS